MSIFEQLAETAAQTVTRYVDHEFQGHFKLVGLSHWASENPASPGQPRFKAEWEVIEMAPGYAPGDSTPVALSPGDTVTQLFMVRAHATAAKKTLQEVKALTDALGADGADAEALGALFSDPPIGKQMILTTSGRTSKKYPDRVFYDVSYKPVP